MSKMELINLEEIFGEISKTRMKTLQKAQEISPFVSGRTIGPNELHFSPDLEEKLKHAQLLETPPPAVDNKTKPKSGAMLKQSKKKLADTIHKSPPQQHLDFEVINASVLLREAEENRKRKVRQLVLDNYHQQQNQRYEFLKSRRKENKEQHLLNVERITDTQLQQQAAELTASELFEGEKELKELRAQTKRQLQHIAFEAVAKYQSNFRSKYEIIAKLLMSIDKQELLACAGYNAKLKELIKMFDQLLAKLSKGDCDVTDISTAENICKSLDALELSIVTELENIVRTQQKAAVTFREAEKVEQKKLELPQQPHQLPEEKHSEAIVETVTATVNKQVDETDSTTEINNYRRLEEHVKPLADDKSMKKFCASLRKAIVIPINAISAVSAQHLQDKYDKLINLLTGKPFASSDGNLTINHHPLGKDYCLLLMANIFVSQCETAKSTTPETAFPIASVILSIWKRLPEFGTFFLACIFKEAPLLQTHFVPQEGDEKNPLAYCKHLGYHVVDGQIEDQTGFLKRQAAIARLYAAIMIVSGRKLDSNIIHPHGIDNGWRWLAHISNQKPLAEVSATLIAAFLETIAAELWLTYGRQFLKLMIFLERCYLPQTSAQDDGPTSRIRSQLDRILRQGTVGQVKGKLPPGFW